MIIRRFPVSQRADGEASSATSVRLPCRQVSAFEGLGKELDCPKLTVARCAALRSALCGAGQIATPVTRHARYRAA